MRVLLISANTETINMPVLPLGMAFVARSAEDSGHVVSQINLMMAPEAEETLVQGIRLFQPDIIGISVRNIDDQVSLQPRFLLDPVKPIVGICRQHSAAKIVLGGAGYSIFPQSALSYLDADMGIQGEGESAFVELLRRMEEGSDISDIPGLHYPEFGIANPPAAHRRIDGDTFPDSGQLIPAVEPAKDGIIWLPFQTRRGCPLDCSYCSTPTIEGRITRKRAIRPVVDALRRYASAGWHHIFFVDNTFNMPESYARQLCSEMALSGLKIAWRAIVYPWKMDEELAVKMAESGCVEVSLGFESGAESILGRMKKRYRTDDIRRSSDLLKKAGIRRMGFLLLGSPGETRETVMESLEFADSLELDMVKVTIGPRIYPETDLARQARGSGNIAPDDDLLYPRFYIEKGMEDWIRSTLDVWMRDRSNWIH